jgi:hypothetical protein
MQLYLTVLEVKSSTKDWSNDKIAMRRERTILQVCAHERVNAKFSTARFDKSAPVSIGPPVPSFNQHDILRNAGCAT